MSRITRLSSQTLITKSAYNNKINKMKMLERVDGDI